MVVGFFSDDGSALYAALLASCGLACVNRDMTVIEGTGIGRPSCEPSIKDAAASRTELVAALAAALAGGRGDVAFVAPLDLLHDSGISAHMDIAVVSGGDPLQARRARRSAGYAPSDRLPSATGHGGAAGTIARRPWILTFGAWRRRVRDAPSGSWMLGRDVEPTVRMLPIEIPLPGRSVKAAMERGLPTLETLRIGILLAATLEVAVADPNAATVDPATMVDLMSSAAHPADRALAERLSDLADRLDDIERALEAPASPPPSIRQNRGSQRRRDGRAGRAAVAELPPASWPMSGASARGR